MQMRMMHQIGPPTVQDGEKANLRAQVLGIGGYGTQGLGRGLKEDVIDHLLVLVSDRGNLVRNGKDDVEVLAVEKFRLAVFDPLGAGQRLAFWAMPIAARTVANALLAALIALFDLSSESCRPAQFDGSHDAPLRCGHGRAMLVSISFAVTAEDIRHFPLRPIHSPSA
jgi:hypothetical protein